MEIINEFSLFGELKAGIIPSMIICVLGLVIYNFLIIASAKSVRKFSDIKLAVWWNDNQISFVLSLILA